MTKNTKSKLNEKYNNIYSQKKKKNISTKLSSVLIVNRSFFFSSLFFMVSDFLSMFLLYSHFFSVKFCKLCLCKDNVKHRILTTSALSSTIWKERKRKAV